MELLFTAATALAISLAIIPLMIRLAPRLRLLDQPNARKVHSNPTPRVGGWGIAAGTLGAIMLWLPTYNLPLSFLLGGTVLFIAGSADDMFDLPGRLKLVLQFIAVVPVVISSGLVVDVLPLVQSIELPYAVAMPIGVAALVACINATNTSDGLDGLAAGSTLLSLFGLLYLAHVAEASQVLLVAAAALGGLVGFLRYNTYPAVIFMGDLGSQFLGFTVGFLALALLHVSAVQVSPWALLLIVGLPVADIVVVACRRLIANESVFKADKSHIHHRFLGIGFSHTQSVVAFYTAQCSFVFFGVSMHLSETWQIMLVYGIHLVCIYGFLYFAEALNLSRTVWNKRISSKPIGSHNESRLALLWGPRLFLETIVPLALVTCSIVTTKVTVDFGVLGAILLLLMIVRFFVAKMQSTDATRVPVFIAATAIVYLYTNNRPFSTDLAWLLESTVITLLAVSAFIAVRFSPKRRKEEFRATSMDYLIALFAVLTVVALRTVPSAFNPYFLVYLPVVLYACEFLLVERRQRTNWLPPAVAIATGIIALRGLM